MKTQTNTHKKTTALKKLHQVLVDHQHVYLSTADLFELGIFSPGSGISRLKASGAEIDTVYQSVTDQDGTIHKRVAFYKIVGGGAS